MTGIRSTIGTRRPKGTGTVSRETSGWVARAPVTHANDKATTIIRGQAFRHQAEAAIDAWLKENRPDAYTALYTGRGEAES